MRARVDESAKDDDAFENREAKSRNELDEKDYFAQPRGRRKTRLFVVE